MYDCSRAKTHQIAQSSFLREPLTMGKLPSGGDACEKTVVNHIDCNYSVSYSCGLKCSKRFSKFPRVL